MQKRGNQSYAGYTSWKIQLSWFFDSNATFVKPAFRRRWIWKDLKLAQIQNAKKLWCKWFTTVINIVNTEAYEMMKSFWCRFEDILGESAQLVWRRVFLKF